MPPPPQHRLPGAACTWRKKKIHPIPPVRVQVVRCRPPTPKMRDAPIRSAPPVSFPLVCPGPLTGPPSPCRLIQPWISCLHSLGTRYILVLPPSTPKTHILRRSVLRSTNSHFYGHLGPRPLPVRAHRLATDQGALPRPKAVGTYHCALFGGFQW